MRLWLLLPLLLPVLTTTVPTVDEEVIPNDEKVWRANAIRKLWEEREKMAHTPLFRMELHGLPMTDIFIKNETASSSGTLKHRFVWALTLWAVVERKIKSNTTVYDSTSGNTGASEAYMCTLIGVPYMAVVANDLEEEKVKQITSHGGLIMKVPVDQRNAVAEREANKNGGFFINQFGNADSAEEFHESGDYGRESTNVFHEIVQQLGDRNYSLPDYFVHSAGTGGTISSVGKYITRYALPTKVIMADSQYSLFYDYVLTNKYSNISANDSSRPKWRAPGVAGIGYGYNPDPIIFKKTTSLLRTVIDEVARVPDMATVAAMRTLRERKIDAGASTALNFLVALYKGIKHEELKQKDKRLSLVIIMGDPGKFYQSTYFNNTWVDTKLAGQGGMKALYCWQANIDRAISKGTNFMENATSCAV